MSLSMVRTLPETSVWDNDPLLLLPRKHPRSLYKQEVIYTPEDYADSIFLVVRGAVKLSRMAQSGRETVLDFLGADEFFGESAMQRRGLRGEAAAAIADAAVMEWSLDELNGIMLRAPELGGALLRAMADRTERMQARFESMAIDPIAQRVIKALLRLGEAFGEPGPGTSLHVMPITHDLLAKYVGTSRELVTQHMSALRRKNLVRYSRLGLDFDPVALQKQLAAQRRTNGRARHAQERDFSADVARQSSAPSGLWASGL